MNEAVSGLIRIESGLVDLIKRDYDRIVNASLEPGGHQDTCGGD